MRARLRSLLHDLRRTARGAIAWGRYLLTTDRLDLALGALEVEGDDATEGAGIRCRVRVANASSRAREATLILELAPAEADSTDPYARFTKRLEIPSLGLARVELDHASGASPRLRVDGRPALLDQEAAGTPPGAGLLSIRARLLESGRDLHPPLVVYQALGR